MCILLNIFYYQDGEQFDSSVGRGPFDFVIGSGQVIKGWEQGNNKKIKFQIKEFPFQLFFIFIQDFLECVQVKKGN